MIIARTTEPITVNIPEATAERIQAKIGDSGQIESLWLDVHGYGWAIWFEYRKNGRTEKDFVRLEK